MPLLLTVGSMENIYNFNPVKVNHYSTTATKTNHFHLVIWQLFVFVNKQEATYGCFDAGYTLGN